MDKVVRTAVSLEPKLLEEFDVLVREKGYDTRSEAIRDIVRRALIQESLRDSTAHCVGTIAVLLEEKTGPASDQLTEIQHRFHDVISSATHIHLDQDRCLEVLIVHGTLATVRALHQGISVIEGAKVSAPSLLTGDPVDHVHD